MIMQVTMLQKQEEVRNTCILKEALTRCHHTNILSMYTAIISISLLCIYGMDELVTRKRLSIIEFAFIVYVHSVWFLFPRFRQSYLLCIALST